jgi:threonine dehydrogenase-like Zn-dependent dehydrogenase
MPSFPGNFAALFSHSCAGLDIADEESSVTRRHEFSGTVSEVGEGATGLTKGDNVVVEPYFVDGDCDMCQAGRYRLCRQMGFIGLSVANQAAEMFL